MESPTEQIPSVFSVGNSVGKNDTSSFFFALF